MIIVGSRDGGSAIVAGRNEDYKRVGVDDAGMMRLVFPMIVIHAKMHVLKWRHIQRQEERQASLYCNDATHRLGLYMRRQTFVHLRSPFRTPAAQRHPVAFGVAPAAQSVAHRCQVEYNVTSAVTCPAVHLP